MAVAIDLLRKYNYIMMLGAKADSNETAKLPGYTDEMKPQFHSTATSFNVVLKNVNYSTSASDEVSGGVGDEVMTTNELIEFTLCLIPGRRFKISVVLNLSDISEKKLLDRSLFLVN